VFISKRISLLTIFALVVTSLSGLTSAASANTSPFSTFTVNGTTVVDGAVVVITPDTKSADVVVSGTLPYDINAGVSSIGATAESVPNEDFTVSTLTKTFSNLPFGDSELWVRTGNALEPSSIYLASVTLRVVPLLSSLTIDGVAVEDGEIVDLLPNTSSVEVVATAVDPAATVTVLGATGLQVGSNELSVTVVDSNNVTGVYSVNLNVPASSDTNATITINEEPLTSGDNTTVPYGTTEVTVAVELNDPNATYFVTGELGLQTGDNLVTVAVTAADTVTIEEYTFNVEVLLNTDTSVNSITINGTPVVDGDEIDVDPLTTEITVDVDTVDTDATIEVVGDIDLVVGGNLVTVYVTAADGATTQEYQFVVNVLVNTDTSAISINVAGNEVGDADFVTVEPLTTEVEVTVELTDPDASYVVEGDTDLIAGDNDLLITVTAADGETTQEYFITITVLPNTDTSLSSLEVNGESVVDGDVIEVPAFTEDVLVDVITTDEFASFVVDGNEGLVVGENTITVTVTAADESTTQDYFVTVIVALSNDASAADISVFWTSPDGEQSSSASDGDVVDLTPATTEVEIVVEPTDAEATYEITGGSNLVLGANELVVVITAPDGEATETFTITLNVLPSSDASFSGITVNGKTWVDEQILEVEAGDLDIQVARNNEFANILVTPSGGARTVVRDGFGYTVASGFAEILIEVTAQDGETVESATLLIWASSDVQVVPNTATADGLLRVGTFVKLPRAQFDMAAKLTYSWVRNGEEIDGATSAKYLLTAEDFGADVRPVITLAKKGSPAVTILGKPFEIAEGLMTKAPVPTVKGKAVVGNTLTATTKDWMDGTELSYQWYRDGYPIEGADTDTYDLTGEDGEAKVTVGITGTLPGYESMEKMSNGLNIALGTLKYSDKPSIEGSYVTGGLLTVNVGSWQDEADISIVWLRDGDVFYEGPADENTYELTSDDYGSRIGIQVKVSAAGYKNFTFAMKSRLIKLGTVEEIPTPVISGEAIVGGILTADPGEYPNGAEFTYVWKRNGKVVQGSTDSSYEVNSRDVNTTLTVKVIATIPGYKTTRIDSDGVDITPAQ
jgi:hypothetical protein